MNTEIETQQQCTHPGSDGQQATTDQFPPGSPVNPQGANPNGHLSPPLHGAHLPAQPPSLPQYGYQQKQPQYGYPQYVSPTNSPDSQKLMGEYEGNSHNHAAMCPEPTSRIRVSLIEAYLLMIVLGIFGAHHFYLKRPRWGLLYLFTFGLLGAGWLIDIFRLPVLVAGFNNKASHPDPSLAKKKRLDDAYVLWFPGGLIGLHHFYLNNTRLGIFYLCTFGIFGIGWLIDAFLMPYHVKIANSDSQDSTEKRLTTTCILAISPTGLLGAHHYYLNRFGFGLLYTFTFGIFGIGYIVDWFRFPVLLKRSNKARTMFHSSHKHLDDAYLLWFPLGFLGFHHFYLNRRGWGLLYMYTFGFLGIGWLVDLCRMRTLVENCNRDIDERVHLTGSNIGIPNPTYKIDEGHVPLNHGQTGPCPPGYSNPHPGIYPTQQNGYGSVPGMNDQPPPYEAPSIPTKGH